MKRVILFLILFYSISYSIFPQFYVSPSGIDTSIRDGSSGAPFAKINYALSRRNINLPASTPLTINIISGNYNQPVSIQKYGSKDYPIVIQADNPNSKPIFYGNIDSIFKGFGYDAIFRWPAPLNNITLDGIKIKNAVANDTLNGIWIEGNYNIVRNCELDSIKRSGIVVQGSYNIIDSNTVNHIIGRTADDSLRGNCIDVETYYNGHDSSNSDYNTIGYNTLINNPTHFGINIFPYTDEISQPLMYGNKIYYNYINHTGGIYTRYQVDLQIIGNVITNCDSSTSWGTPGGGITFDGNSNHPRTLPINADTIKIYNNTIADNKLYGIINNTSNNLFIKNNIFSNNGGGSFTGHQWHIAYQFSRSLINSTSQIDYNLYFGNIAEWRWGDNSNYSTFSAWQDTSGMDINGKSGLDPSFVGGSGSDPYKIQLHSPAKNIGTPLPEVTKDIKGMNRPYWPKGVDVGAYEIDEAQFRIGWPNNYPGGNVNHYITAIGTFWAKSSNTWPISNDQSLASSTYIMSAQSDTDKEKWEGFRFKWIIDTTSEIPFGHALYKVSNSNNNHYFYIDFRDAIATYNPNIYIRYNNSTGYNKYEYYTGNSFQPIQDSSIIRIWDMNNGSVSYTAGLSDYWNHALVCVNKSNHPNLIFGPCPNSSSSNYLVYKYVIPEYGWQYLATSSTGLTYQDATESYVLHNGSHPVSYKIMNYICVEDCNPDTSNAITTTVNGPNEEKQKSDTNHSIPLYYSLNQNFPNPFNPSTKIRYSIKDVVFVNLVIYDILGRRIETLVNEEKSPGEYEINFSGHNLASGVYLYKLTAGTFTQIKKMQILK